jgi:hypothetical protein
LGKIIFNVVVKNKSVKIRQKIYFMKYDIETTVYGCAAYNRFVYVSPLKRLGLRKTAVETLGEMAAKIFVKYQK